MNTKHNFIKAFARRHPFIFAFGMFFIFIFLTAESCDDSVPSEQVDLPASYTPWSWIDRDSNEACPTEVEPEAPYECSVKVWSTYNYTKSNGDLTLGVGEVIEFTDNVSFDATGVGYWHDENYFITGPGEIHFNMPAEERFTFFWYVPTGFQYSTEDYITEAEADAQIQAIVDAAATPEIPVEIPAASTIPTGNINVSSDDTPCYYYPSRTGDHITVSAGEYMVWPDGRGDYGIYASGIACYLPLP